VCAPGLINTAVKVEFMARQTHVACTLTCRREMLHMPFSLRLTAYAFVPLALPLINSQRVESGSTVVGTLLNDWL